LRSARRSARSRDVDREGADGRAERATCRERRVDEEVRDEGGADRAGDGSGAGAARGARPGRASGTPPNAVPSPNVAAGGRV
jgi:hypothetical protein